jgi:hypothetical protein
MCFSDYLAIYQDSYKTIWIRENENEYKNIKKIKLTIDVQKKEPINVNTKFAELFAVYNIANIFENNVVKQHINRIINQRFITNEQLYILLQEYIDIYENYVFDVLL